MTYPIIHFVKDGGENHPLKLELLLERVDRLVIHEETIKENLEELRRSFQRSSFFWHPIIVDRKTRVVLDGMHRVSSIKELGYQYIPVLTIDAMDPYVKLERWIRCYMNGEGNPLGVLRENGFEVEEVWRGDVRDVTTKSHEARGGVLKGVFHLIDLQGGVAYRVFCGNGDPVEIYSRVRRAEKLLERELGEVKYTTIYSLLEGIGRHRYTWAIIPPPLTKEEVFEAATSGKLFCPKATRFVLPVRVMFVNTPVYLLEEGEMSLEERNRLNYLILRQKRLFKIEGNVDIDRHYEEPYLYMFE